MLLSSEVVQHIEKAIRVAKIVGIDKLIVEPTSIRGIDDARSVFLLQTENLPVIPVQLAIGRLNLFQARLDVVKTQDKFSIETVSKTVKDTKTYTDYEFVYMLVMKAGKTKIDFRCVDPARIEVPRKIKTVDGVNVAITPEVVNLLQKGMAATGADTVKLLSTSAGVSFEMIDVNGDVFSHTFADEADGQFAVTLNAKTLLALLKEQPEQTVVVTDKTLIVTSNGIPVYIVVRK